jgi:hypothetical protein
MPPLCSRVSQQAAAPRLTPVARRADILPEQGDAAGAAAPHQRPAGAVPGLRRRHRPRARHRRQGAVRAADLRVLHLCAPAASAPVRPQCSARSAAPVLQLMTSSGESPRCIRMEDIRPDKICGIAPVLAMLAYAVLGRGAGPTRGPVLAWPRSAGMQAEGGHAACGGLDRVLGAAGALRCRSGRACSTRTPRACTTRTPGPSAAS